ncbi:hypothetical protein TELCIR_09145 [Teladorsagia circumcincta]|uniref:Uncharacterized protein n=1 Tax=Teladorsagia circumcincta TaxID=45464 RepID=A0A2G9UFP2_TELCI|nr:hypothetical protein TELCIR_09145 [Teladorsagia circumcincta]
MRILMLSPADVKRWRELIYAEKQRASSAHSSSEEEEDAVNEQKGVECQMLKRIIDELKQALIKKLEKVPQELRWIWKEQIMIVNVVLSSFK